jgi:hypothetical protein
MTHDALCRWQGSTEFDTVVSCDDCELIARVRANERGQAWERTADAVYETTDWLSALKIKWSIDPESQPHEIGLRCYKTGVVEVCQRCGENWPCIALRSALAVIKGDQP